MCSSDLDVVYTELFGRIEEVHQEWIALVFQREELFIHVKVPVEVHIVLGDLAQVLESIGIDPVNEQYTGSREVHLRQQLAHDHALHGASRESLDAVHAGAHDDEFSSLFLSGHITVIDGESGAQRTFNGNRGYDNTSVDAFEPACERSELLATLFICVGEIGKPRGGNQIGRAHV